MGGEAAYAAKAQDEDPGSLEGGGQFFKGKLYRPLGGGESRSEKTDGETVEGFSN